jgi:AraC-like DNA-binding protein
VEHESPSILRPEWVYQVARHVERFVRSARDTEAPPCLDRFLTSLPVAERELEHQIIDDLRRHLVTLGQRPSGAPAERALRLLVEDYRQPWTLEGLARTVGCNRTTLQKSFRTLTSTSVHRFLIRHRVSIAKQLLTGSDLKVSSIAHEVGYKSHSAFARHFKSLTGSTLTTYRVRQNKRPS